MKLEKNALVEALESALHNARSDAAGYADMGQTEDSIHADGVADGLKQALEIVRNAHPEKSGFLPGLMGYRGETPVLSPRDSRKFPIK